MENTRRSKIISIMVAHPRQVLATIWFCGAAALFVLMISLSVGDAFFKVTNSTHVQAIDKRHNIERAWNWFIPTMFPTLSLISSAFIHDAVKQKNYEQESSKSLFLLTVSISMFYILSILVTIFTINAAQKHFFYPIEWLEISNLWITPLQGLTVGVMGAYFIHRTPEGEGKTPDGNNGNGTKPAAGQSTQSESAEKHGDDGENARDHSPESADDMADHRVDKGVDAQDARTDNDGGVAREGQDSPPSDTPKT